MPTQGRHRNEARNEWHMPSCGHTDLLLRRPRGGWGCGHRGARERGDLLRSRQRLRAGRARER
jgi:hypothetical protein